MESKVILSLTLEIDLNERTYSKVERLRELLSEAEELEGDVLHSLICAFEKHLDK